MLEERITFVPSVSFATAVLMRSVYAATVAPNVRLSVRIAERSARIVRMAEYAENAEFALIALAAKETIATVAIGV